MFRFVTKLTVVSVLVLPYTMSFAQGIGPLLRDNKIPERIKPSDLGDDMRAVKLGVDKQGNDFMSSLMSPFMLLGSLFSSGGGGGETTESQAASRFFDMLSISWTNGSTYSLYGEEYLITYGLQIDFSSIARSKTPPDVSKMELGLTLVKTKSITTITPRPDMTKGEWMKTPSMAQSMESKKSTTLSNIKQLSLGTIMYASDYDDELPYVQSTRGIYEVTYPYLKTKEVTKSLNPNGGDFRLNMAIAGVNMTAIERPAETPLFYDMTAWPDGTRAVAFADGHAKFVDPDQWEKLRPYLSLKLKRTSKPLPANLGLGRGTG